jgi:hypothetical protein
VPFTKRTHFFKRNLLYINELCQTTTRVTEDQTRERTERRTPLEDRKGEGPGRLTAGPFRGVRPATKRTHFFKRILLQNNELRQSKTRVTRGICSSIRPRTRYERALERGGQDGEGRIEQKGVRVWVVAVGERDDGQVGGLADL